MVSWDFIRDPEAEQVTPGQSRAMDVSVLSQGASAALLSVPFPKGVFLLPMLAEGQNPCRGGDRAAVGSQTGSHGSSRGDSSSSS